MVEEDLPKALQLLLGTIVAGRYVVDAYLGMGGMAIVFSGRHATLDRKVAIKFLRPEYTLNPEVAARFDREARAASSLEHPNCIQVFDCGSTKVGLKFMVMPLLEGAELSRVLVELAATDPPTKIPPSQAVGMGMQLLRGLEHAHGRSLVHRDLKPDNIFVTRDHEGNEVLKIVDFGIAKIVNEAMADGLTTKVGAIVGTPAYISPEQALGSEVDARADLYAMGVVLYQLLSGKPPFVAADARGLLYQHATQPPPPLPDSVPEKLRDVVFKLLEKKAAARYDGATQAAAALEAAAQELRTDPTPWISLLELKSEVPEQSAVRTGGTEIAGRSERSGLDVMDDALKRLLSQETNHAHDQLNSGIFNAPEDGWDTEDSQD